MFHMANHNERSVAEIAERVREIRRVVVVLSPSRWLLAYASCFRGLLSCSPGELNGPRKPLRRLAWEPVTPGVVGVVQRDPNLLKRAST
jgi:hypothetical protein